MIPQELPVTGSISISTLSQSKTYLFPAVSTTTILPDTRLSFCLLGPASNCVRARWEGAETLECMLLVPADGLVVFAATAFAPFLSQGHVSDYGFDAGNGTYSAIGLCYFMITAVEESVCI